MGFDCAKKLDGCQPPRCAPGCCCCQPPKPPSRCILNFRLGLAIYGTISGLMVFFTFGFQFHNWHAATWGLVTGIYAGFSLIVEIGYRRTKWKHNSWLLILFGALSCVAMVAGFTAFPIYLAYAIVEKQGVTAENRSFYVVCVWCAMTFKNAVTLLITSRLYYNLNKLSLNTADNNSINDTDTQEVIMA